MEIRLVPHAEIDKVKWNSCVHYATNGNVFGYKWYLDTIAKEWDGLVEGDYESVLPLFITEKDNWLQQPPLLREAGVYSIHLLSKRRVQAFLNAIPEQYTAISLSINEGIQVAEQSDFSIQQRINHQLLLIEPYENIASQYSPELKQRLQALKPTKLLPSSNVKPEKIAALFKDSMPSNDANEQAFHAYQRIMYNALHRGWGATFGLHDTSQQLLSAAFFIYSQGRVMQLVSASSIKGQQIGAYDKLMDNFLQSHAGRPLVLDFNTDQASPLRFGAKANVFLSLQKGTPPILKKQPSIRKKPIWKFW